jgi:hypothetical protein
MRNFFLIQEAQNNGQKRMRNKFLTDKVRDILFLQLNLLPDSPDTSRGHSRYV